MGAPLSRNPTRGRCLILAGETGSSCLGVDCSAVWRIPMPPNGDKMLWRCGFWTRLFQIHGRALCWTGRALFSDPVDRGARLGWPGQWPPGVDGCQDRPFARGCWCDRVKISLLDSILCVTGQGPSGPMRWICVRTLCPEGWSVSAAGARWRCCAVHRGRARQA